MSCALCKQSFKRAAGGKLRKVGVGSRFFRQSENNITIEEAVKDMGLDVPRASFICCACHRKLRTASNASIRQEVEHTHLQGITDQHNSCESIGKMESSYKPPPPCKVGDPLAEIDTPALIVDLNKLERNLAHLQSDMKFFPGIAVRPHAKAHKCPAIAKLQVAHGAVGMCCQTLVEAEAMVYSGACLDILLSNQIIGLRKLRRFAELAKLSKMMICVDDVNNVKDISEAAKQCGVTIGCVVEANAGQDRCGVEPGQQVAALAEEIQRLPNITFSGIQCYQGWNQHVRKTSDRAAAVEVVVEKTRNCLQALQSVGIDTSYVTGGGTGTYPYEAGSGIFTEIQPGSYVFMDADYNRNLDESGNFVNDYQQSLFVLTTVQSLTPGVRAVVDAGIKALSMDSGVPLVAEKPDLIYNIGGDEHGILNPDGGLEVGDLLWLEPGHCDPTVNMYDWLVGVRDGTVETVWPVLGRGPGV